MTLCAKLRLEEIFQTILRRNFRWSNFLFFFSPSWSLEITSFSQTQHEFCYRHYFCEMSMFSHHIPWLNESPEGSDSNQNFAMGGVWIVLDSSKNHCLNCLKKLQKWSGKMGEPERCVWPIWELRLRTLSTKHVTENDEWWIFYNITALTIAPDMT